MPKPGDLQETFAQVCQVLNVHDVKLETVKNGDSANIWLAQTASSARVVRLSSFAAEGPWMPCVVAHEVAHLRPWANSIMRGSMLLLPPFLAWPIRWAVELWCDMAAVRIAPVEATIAWMMMLV